jgi:hypothetical protein
VEERDVDPLDEPALGVLADRSGHRDRERCRGRLTRPGPSRAATGKVGLAPPMGTNHLLLLIACLAILVALGILTG